MWSAVLLFETNAVLPSGEIAIACGCRNDGCSILATTLHDATSTIATLLLPLTGTNTKRPSGVYVGSKAIGPTERRLLSDGLCGFARSNTSSSPVSSADATIVFPSGEIANCTRD